MHQFEAKNNQKFYLTKEQSQMVADNHNLIYSFLQKHNLPANDDNYSIAAIGLCKAALHYIPEKGTFSTIAYYSMSSEFGRFHYMEKMDKRKIAQYTDCYNFDRHHPVNNPTKCS
jgi:hypothetical protein